MRFADELVDAKNFNFPPATNLRKPELDMAKALVNNLASEWDPAKYTDQYRENLARIIQGKVKGKDVELEPMTERPRAEVVDLMERLRRSLEKSAPVARAASRARRKTPAARKRSRRAA
jgi:DNA end-binding protein Ku